MVYVISFDGKPLMPCSNVIARLLLKQGKAKVKRREPFTIKLTYKSKQYTQNLSLGVDTGSGTLSTAVSTERKKIVYLSEVTVRNDIAKKMTQRSKYRRHRRSRKTRYRKKRFMNKKNSIRKDRFSPTMVSKIHSHTKEIEFVKSILPISEMIFETGKFDPHRMKNPELIDSEIRKWGYQKGPNYRYQNTRAMILDRDHYCCQNCHGKRKDPRLEVHHIIYRRDGGSDEAENLITLCHSCHTDVHNRKVELKVKGKVKGLLRFATQMNSIRIQLLRLYPEAIETFRYVTAANRIYLKLPKEHFIDSCLIATRGKGFHIDSKLYRKRCIPKGDFQQRKGIHSEKAINTGKVQGFRKFDKVKYMGKEYFIKGKMSSGYAILMDLDGNRADFSDMPKGSKTPKMSNIKRLGARSNWMVTTEDVIPSIA